MSTPAFLHPFAKPAAARSDFIEIVRGEGAIVFDAPGNRYVDAMASLWYCQVGHGRAEIAEATADQMRRLGGFHCFEKFTNEPADELAVELSALAPMPGARVFFTDSGSESVETAMKMARVAHFQAGHPEKQIIISRQTSYHGVNYGGTTATGLAANRVGYGELLADVIQVPQHDLDAVGAICATNAGRIAAIITEPVQGAGGVHPPHDGYLEGLRALADQQGAFLIFDEVICGFGRLGTWFGGGKFNVRPDMITFAKGVTSGYAPLGGVLVGEAVRAPLEADPSFILRHGYTYSGHPSACAAGLANLKLMRAENLVERANHIGEKLGPGLNRLREQGLVTDVRGLAGIWGVTLPEGMNNMVVRDWMLTYGDGRRGVIPRPIPGAGGGYLAFCPPLVIEDADLDLILEATEAALRAHA